MASNPFEGGTGFTNTHTFIAQPLLLLHELGFEEGFGLGGHIKGCNIDNLVFTTINRPLVDTRHLSVE